MGTHMAARHVPRNRMNRLVTAGLDRWSSKTELGLQTALAFELGFYLKRLQNCSLQTVKKLTFFDGRRPAF